MIIEKHHRLSPSLYVGKIRVSFTLCINKRKSVFTNKNITEAILSELKKSLVKYNVINWAYIFMPDHMHIVLEGKEKDSNLLKCLKLFKQFSGYWFSKNISGIEWQKDFYDHIHRKEDDLPVHIRYILNNPVRKGLVKDWNDYPFKGSLDNKLNEI
ncbi:MAG: hypothetical protein A2252_12225 [Elusimicrobia bacterium RIFOXYA2_FULL_39_19]|nr:MAG: hypothetical protein A2252_12225 [Elusimicrobia bacterium RIFOXYA2_FULL_39_19]